MTNKFAGLLLYCLCFYFMGNAQTDFRQLTAVRTNAIFKIDGSLEEAAWKTAPVASKFIELRPNTFAKEAEENKTEIFILYNDQGVYIGGYCHEKNKDSIATELVGRDNFGSNDFVGVIFDT